MARTVLLIGCLLATISCLTTAQSTTSVNAITPSPHASNATNMSPNATNMASNATNRASNATTMSPNRTNTAPNTTTMFPNATNMLPNRTNAAPNATTMPPNAPNMASNVTTTSPNRTNTAPNATTMSPNRTNAAPNTTNTPPNATTTNATTPQAPLYGSCAKPDLCCSGLNNSCHRLNCFCDVACLRLNDCCPDFKPTCLAVKNSTNSSNTFPLTGTCSHPTLCCSGTNFNCFRGCFCDEACKQLNDCCPDLNSTCIFNTTTAAPPVNSTALPPFTPSALPPFTPSPTPPKDVLTLLTNLEVEVLAEESSTEAERQAALLQVAKLVESYLRGYNDIYSFEVTRIEPVSPCD
ncbi:mucin-2-like [Onychostoma macrolepis]|uniref:mucin-2-like n=1 Tax=Onychostoma macrolepis TaxID=369639 RepID=UPI002729B736|nr:mucin-2-like [Onychostoma macrolepis]